ncbi:MAG: carboxypeptidase regulatory-like domain-containing protein [Planctomycetaceae bacterium]|jgi:protocatechuate 3,4-dioxygenase beta subunit/peroxiredoxin|nr:carboxypeptidase regulatory-like domain-containing protein [Planctomycetaceae bacterium]
MLNRFTIFSFFLSFIFMAAGLEGRLFAECWAPHERPLNSTLSRDSSVSEIAGGKKLTVTILDESNKPIPKAKFSYFGEPTPHNQKELRHYVEADNNGQFVIGFKPENTQPKLLQIEIDHPNYAPYNATWNNIKADPIPENITIKLEKATQIGGVVIDDSGKPYPNADVEFCIPWGNRSRTPQICQYRVWVKTDEKGVWTCNLIPPNILQNEVNFYVESANFMPSEQEINLSEFLPDKNGVFKRTIKLERGITVKGRITDVDKKPVKNAVVYCNQATPHNNFVTETNENGEYSIKNLPVVKHKDGDAFIGVWAKGKMSTIKDIKLNEKNSTLNVDVTLKPAGKPIKIKIVDKDGNPIPDFIIRIERWGRQDHVEFLLTGKLFPFACTGADGCWTWNEAPDTEVELGIYKSSFMGLNNKAMKARDDEYVLTAFPQLQISGKITDAETNKPVQNFKVYRGMGSETGDEMYWEIMPNSNNDATYFISEDYPSDHFRVKIEAEGYEPAISRKISPNEGTITIDLPLKKLSTKQLDEILKGTVLNPDKTPAAEANVVLITPKHKEHTTRIQYGAIMIQDDEITLEDKKFAVKTDKNGNFKFEWINFEEEHYTKESRTRNDDYVLYVMGKSGFKRITQNEMKNVFNKEPIILEKWGRIEGVAKLGTKPASNFIIEYRPSFGEGDSPSSSLFPSWQILSKSDENGKFCIEQIPPGKGYISRNVFNKERLHNFVERKRINIISTKTTNVQIGGEGRPVEGKIINDSFAGKELKFKYAEFICKPYLEPLPENFSKNMRNLIPESIREEKDINKKDALLRNWQETTEDGKQHKKLSEKLSAWYKQHDINIANKQSAGFVNDDKTIRMDNITEGDWLLEVAAYVEQKMNNYDAIRTYAATNLSHRFKVEKIPGGVSDEPFDLGDLKLTVDDQIRFIEPEPLIRVGQIAPDFEVLQVLPIDKNNNKTETTKTILKLSDYDGKIIILNFWATWSVPCVQRLHLLRELHANIQHNPKFKMIGISLDGEDNLEDISKFIAEKKMNWTHGIIAKNLTESILALDYGIKSIPLTILIGKDGKIILSNPSTQELYQKINELKNE